jgi:hypothetical protein
LNPVTTAFWPASLDQKMLKINQTMVDAALIPTDLNSVAEVFPSRLYHLSSPKLQIRFRSLSDTVI